jgi:dihydroorotate dehydrogenase
MTITNFLFKIARKLDPERAHLLTIQALKLGITPRYSNNSDEVLTSEVFGMKFQNPMGLAAGFDKSAEAFNSIDKLGCGFVEVGTLTLKPQAGNERPRVFRLEEDQAIINRYGFNNDGLSCAVKRLSKRKNPAGILGVNIGINKNSPTPISDYVEALRLASPLADYITINISSPNTPGLRDLQSSEKLEKLLGAIEKSYFENEGQTFTPPILLKIAPDLTEKEIKEIVQIALKTSVSGLVVSNTTVTRPTLLKGYKKTEPGGLSGPPLFELSTKKLAQTYLACKGKIPLIGVGGVDSAETAYAKIRAGASLVQLYTAVTYRGPRLFKSINDGLDLLIKNDNFRNVQDAVGIDAKYWADKKILD